MRELSECQRIRSITLEGSPLRPGLLLATRSRPMRGVVPRSSPSTIVSSLGAMRLIKNRSGLPLRRPKQSGCPAHNFNLCRLPPVRFSPTVGRFFCGDRQICQNCSHHVAASAIRRPGPTLETCKIAGRQNRSQTTGRADKMGKVPPRARRPRDPPDPSRPRHFQESAALLNSRFRSAVILRPAAIGFGPDVILKLNLHSHLFPAHNTIITDFLTPFLRPFADY